MLTSLSVGAQEQKDTLYFYNGSNYEKPPLLKETNIRDSLSIAKKKYYYNNQSVYKINPAIDIPLTAVTTGWTLYAFTKIYSKDPSSEEAILALDKNNINGFDRWGMYPFDEKLDNISYIPFYAVMPLPLLSLADSRMRKDILKIGFLYLQAMSTTGLLYTSATYFTNRYRPYAYAEETEMSKKTNGNAKNSFFAGHVALVGTSAFFMAKVYDDYHPDSKLKWAFYGLAAATTGITAYWRLKGGQHFPSDILLGTAVGTLSGLLVPALHKNKLIKNPNISLVPFSGRTHGLAMIYKL